MPRNVLNPPDLFNSVQYGFSQIALTRLTAGARLITVSGQVGWDADEQMPADDGLRAQTERAFANLAAALTHAGAGMADVLSLRIYIAERAMSDLKPVSDGLRAAFPTEPPTATWIGVPRLANHAFLIEIEAWAVTAE